MPQNTNTEHQKVEFHTTQPPDPEPVKGELPTKTDSPYVLGQLAITDVILGQRDDTTLEGLETHAPSVLDPNNWLIMKQTDLLTINAQITEAKRLLAERGTPEFFFLNNFPSRLIGGRRRVGEPQKLLDSDNKKFGRKTLRYGDSTKWTEELCSDHIKGMTNGEFHDELDAAVEQVGAARVAGLSTEGFGRLNGLRTAGQLKGDDVGRYDAFLLEVYKLLRQAGFSHYDLWY